MCLLCSLKPECKFFLPSMISHWGSLSRLLGEGV
jgi:hypothetical protein